MIKILILLGFIGFLFESITAAPTADFYLQYTYNPAFTKPNPEVGQRVSAWNRFTSRQNPEELGTYFEGDIMLKPSQGRTVLRNPVYKWTGGIVPIQFSSNFTSAQIKHMLSSLTYLHQRTCIRFVTKQPWHVNYVTVTADSTGCYSYIGMQGGEQQLNLQPDGCLNDYGTVMHEFMHALGFIHEFTRWDRDTYVSVNMNNVSPVNAHNFNKYDSSQVTAFNIPYDYNSIMHYSAYAFAVDLTIPTIIPKFYAPFMGQRLRVSESDLIKINRLYSCEITTLPKPLEDFPLTSRFNDVEFAPSLSDVVLQYLYKNLEINAPYPVDNINLSSETQTELLIDVGYMWSNP